MTNSKRTVSCGGKALLALAVASLLVGCAGLQRDAAYPDRDPTQGTPRYDNEETASIFGPGGLTIFGGKKEAPDAAVPIPVNSFLWRASLDTLSFLPLSSADPFGGVIITDWFTPPESANERFKMTVYILSRDLRADGLRVAVFRQLNDGQGNWVDGGVSPETATELENAILTRARELLVASVEP